MLIRKLGILLCAMIATYAPATLADCSGLTCTSVYIEMLNAEAGELPGSDDVWVQTSGAESALNCTANSGIYLKLRNEAPSRKEVYAMLLTAFAMDKPISLRVVDSSVDCVIAYAYITR